MPFSVLMGCFCLGIGANAGMVSTIKSSTRGNGLLALHSVEWMCSPSLKSTKSPYNSSQYSGVQLTLAPDNSRDPRRETVSETCRVFWHLPPLCCPIISSSTSFINCFHSQSRLQVTDHRSLVKCPRSYNHTKSFLTSQTTHTTAQPFSFCGTMDAIPVPPCCYTQARVLLSFSMLAQYTNMRSRHTQK